MKITYILDRPELGGGVKVVYQHAQLLAQKHEVTVLARGPCPDWAGFSGTCLDYAASMPKLDTQDLVIATYWTTIPVALEMDAGPVLHFCQGYEASYPHLFDKHERIRKAYRHPLPAFVVAPHLGDFLKKEYGRSSVVVSPPLQTCFRPRFRMGPARLPVIALCGIFECSWKGVQTGLRAVEMLRGSGMKCRLHRFSLLPICDEEKGLLEADQYHHGLAPEAMAEQLKQCDLLLFPSHEEEGFGLPLLEAMASKVPAVASNIPSTRYITRGQVPLVPFDEPEAFAREAIALLSSRRAWNTARRSAYSQASRFYPSTISRQLELGLEWARQEVAK